MDSTAVVTPPYVAGPLELHPFRALRLRSSRVGDPASARLYARPYRKVAQRVDTWLGRGDLIRDNEPALYLHEYTTSGVTVRGVVGALDLSRRAPTAAAAAVLPHEGTRPAQTRELAIRMREMDLQPAPILMIQKGPRAVRDLLSSAMAQAPVWSYDDRGGQRHRIWPLRDPATIAALNEAWAPTRALIADGHHRYAAYLRDQAHRPGTAADTGLAMIVDHDATPLDLGAVHRTLEGTSMRQFARTADARAAWEPTSRKQALQSLGPHCLAATDGRAWATLRLSNPASQPAVDHLHHTLMPRLDQQPHRIAYHHGIDQALDRVKRTKSVAVLLPPPTLDQILETVLAGTVLPQKATSFQPKPHAGALIRSLRDAPGAP